MIMIIMNVGIAIPRMNPKLKLFYFGFTYSSGTSNPLAITFEELIVKFPKDSPSKPVSKVSKTSRAFYPSITVISASSYTEPYLRPVMVTSLGLPSKFLESIASKSNLNCFILIMKVL